MVAGQSCIAGPSVFPPRATLDCPARHTFLGLACAQTMPTDSACWRRGSQEAFNVCKPMRRVSDMSSRESASCACAPVKQLTNSLMLP
jgi:hypothetical protein